jgi:hypothetical protein
MPHSTSGSTPLSGLTINERLFTSGLLGKFDAAARRGDRAAMLLLLRTVELSDADAIGCINAILSDPKRYGY